jgi:hypothetical protein
MTIADSEDDEFIGAVNTMCRHAGSGSACPIARYWLQTVLEDRAESAPPPPAATAPEDER